MAHRQNSLAAPAGERPCPAWQHSHGHAQRYDGIGTADNGAEEKYQGKYHGKGNGQTSEKYRQFVDDID